MTSGAAAGRYARALFDTVLAEAPGSVEAVEEQLQQFADLVARDEVLVSVFGNPAIPASKKVGVVRALLDRAGPMSAPLSKLIVMLAERDRLILLSDVARAYRVRVMDHLKIVRGEVTTAVPLPSDKLRALEQSLERATGRKVLLETTVDPSIIGGVVTRLGSTVYDGSVTTQLEKMKQVLIEAGQ
jgi:F-type H+-transporting ATPase subunit delta